MKKKIIVVGPALSQTGYGEQCRFALRALMSNQEDFDVYLKPVPWGKSSWIPFDSEDRNWIDMLIRKTMLYGQSNGNFDASLQITIPNEWDKVAPINIGYTAGIETTKVSPEWIEKSRLMDRIITISNHSKNVYLETSYDARMSDSNEIFKVRCETPIDVVHYGVRSHKQEDVKIDLDYDFNFLAVAQWGPRKNLENTVRWWIEEFKDEEVGLVVKTNLYKTSIIDREHTLERMKRVISDYKDTKCKVYLIHGNMTAGELTGLYRHPKIKCMVSLTHGEGFGLPLFEAAYNELPVIAPDWSGHKDFLYAPKKHKKKGKTITKVKAHFGKVDYNIKPIQKEVVWKGVLQQDSSWCYAKKESYMSRLRDVYSNYNRYKNQSKSLKKSLVNNFSEKEKYSDFVHSVKSACGLLIDDEVDSMFEFAMQKK